MPQKATKRSKRTPGKKKKKETPRIEISAGGIVFQRRKKGPHVAFILDPFDKWTFAKGHVRIGRGESLEKGAKRETEEEMGLKNLRVLEKLGTTDIWFRDRFEHKGALVHKFITYFLMEVAPGEHGKPQKKELISEISWVPIEKVSEVPIYPNTVDLLKRAVRIIRKTTKKKKK